MLQNILFYQEEFEILLVDRNSLFKSFHAKLLPTANTFLKFQNAHEKLFMLRNMLFYQEEFQIPLVDGKGLSGFMQSYYLLQTRS